MAIRGFQIEFASHELTRIWSRLAIAWVSPVLAQQPAPLLRRLDDATRARVLAALAALVILGIAMVLLAWLGARIAQRYRHGPVSFRPTPRPGEHDWAKKPLYPAEPEPPPSATDRDEE